MFWLLPIFSSFSLTQSVKNALRLSAAWTGIVSRSGIAIHTATAVAVESWVLTAVRSAVPKNRWYVSESRWRWAQAGIKLVAWLKNIPNSEDLGPIDTNMYCLLWIVRTVNWTASLEEDLLKDVSKYSNESLRKILSGTPTGPAAAVAIRIMWSADGWQSPMTISIVRWFLR